MSLCYVLKIVLTSQMTMLMICTLYRYQMVLFAALSDFCKCVIVINVAA